MKLKLLEVKQALRKRINTDVYTQGKWLNKILTGHYNYYAIPDNSVALDRFKTALSRLWVKLLKRRSQKSRVNWKRLTKLIRYFLPSPRILHPYPNQRLRVWLVVGAVCVSSARTDLYRRGGESWNVLTNQPFTVINNSSDSFDVAVSRAYFAGITRRDFFSLHPEIWPFKKYFDLF